MLFPMNHPRKLPCAETRQKTGRHDPGLQCGDCGQDRDSQSHCLVFPAWAEARDRLLHRGHGALLSEGPQGQGEKEKKRRKGGG